MIRIIPATVEDYEKIKDFYQELSDLHVQGAKWNFQKVPVSLKKEYFESRLQQKDSHFLLAECDGITVGYIAFEIRKSESIDILQPRTWLFIEDIFISSHHRGSGIGSLLLEYAEEYAKSHKIDSIELSVWSFNTEAIDFYKNR